MIDHPTSGRPEDVLDHIEDNADLIVPLANGEPVSVLDAIEANAERFRGVRVHQMHALHDRPYLHGDDARPPAARVVLPVAGDPPGLPGAAAASWCRTTSARSRGCSARRTRCSMVLAAAAPMDRHGYFSLGTNCDYVAPFIGRVPFFLEVNARMPRTFGRNRSTSARWRAGPRSTVRWSRSTRPQPSDDRRTHRRATSPSASRTAPTIQAGHRRRFPNALLAGAARPPRPRRAHRVAVRRARRPRRGGVVDRHPQAARARQGRDHLRPRHPAALRLPRTRTRRSSSCPVDYVNDPRVIARGGVLRFDQRHDRGRPRRPVRLGDGRRPLLVLERRPGRLRRGRHVLAAWHGVHRAAVDRGPGDASPASGPRSPPARW